MYLQPHVQHVAVNTKIHGIHVLEQQKHANSVQMDYLN